MQLHYPLYVAVYKIRLYLVWSVLFLFCETEEEYQLQLVKALNVKKPGFLLWQSCFGDEYGRVGEGRPHS